MNSYKVSFTNNQDVEIDTAVFREVNEKSLEKLVQDYVNTKGFLNYLPTVSWSATTIVAKGTISKPVAKEVEIDDTSDYAAHDDVYCRNCGSDENIAFIATYASGDYYKCKSCKINFHA